MSYIENVTNLQDFLKEDIRWFSHGLGDGKNMNSTSSAVLLHLNKNDLVFDEDKKELIFNVGEYSNQYLNELLECLFKQSGIDTFD